LTRQSGEIHRSLEIEKSRDSLFNDQSFVHIRLGTAETEAILRRFTRNLQHPTYKALTELGKAIKTIFL